MQILAAGFLGIILMGAILLWLPISNTRPISFVDALFTAVSSVCVTGLVTVTPAVQFTLFGKIALLLLIQVGGLGVVACVTAFFLIIKKRISVKERMMISEIYNMESLSGMVAMIIRIIKGTFLVEGIGAVLYAFQFIPEYGLVKGIWYSVFHAVSAFCSAGIDIMGDSGFIRFLTNPLMNFTTMMLVIVSGLGFPVWQDLFQIFQGVKEKEIAPHRWFQKLRLHSKLVLVMTVILLLGGTVIFLLLEYNNPETFGPLTFEQKVMAALFHSVSTRTGGFVTVPQIALTESSLFITCLLMFIGGSPGGTSGGVKTTTIAMLLLSCRSVVRNEKDVECFGRRILTENIRTGMSIVMIAVVVLFAGTTVITVLESNASFIRVLFEATSALGTVGLTTNLTPQLCTASKFIIMILMYIGRIGPITFTLAFGARRNPKNGIRQLPAQGILVG